MFYHCFRCPFYCQGFFIALITAYCFQKFLFCTFSALDKIKIIFVRTYNNPSHMWPPDSFWTGNKFTLKCRFTLNLFQLFQFSMKIIHLHYNWRQNRRDRNHRRLTLSFKVVSEYKKMYVAEPSYLIKYSL